VSAAVYRNSVLKNVFIITHQGTKQIEYVSLAFPVSKKRHKQSLLIGSGDQILLCGALVKPHNVVIVPLKTAFSLHVKRFWATKNEISLTKHKQLRLS